jgi:hypothetical protein
VREDLGHSRLQSGNLGLGLHSEALGEGAGQAGKGCLNEGKCQRQGAVSRLTNS